MESSSFGAIPEDDEEDLPCAFPKHLAVIICGYLPHPHCLQIAVRVPRLSDSLTLWRYLCQRQYPIVLRRGKGKRRKHRKLMEASNNAGFWRQRYCDIWTDVVRQNREHKQKMRDLEYSMTAALSKRQWQVKREPRYRSKH
mmetsp:Transcript_11836/g.16534  ORF Transcript_11836/g.16534 Transcript_11836/m.16534 type:complete len:141 (+) Transcript_11836:16-438(+)